MKLKFRPHHFLCALAFEGKGYSPAFVKNFYRILDALKKSPEEIEIEVVNQLDDICAPCPNHHNQQCISETLIQRLDAAHAKILNLQTGDHLTWEVAKARLKKHMTLEKFHEACAPCQWKSLGVCEKKLSALK